MRSQKLLLAALALGAALSLTSPCIVQAADKPASTTHQGSGQLRFTDVALSDAIDYLRDLTGANIVVDWRSLEAVNVTKETLINVRLHGVTLRQALHILLNEAAGGNILTFTAKDNVITITTLAQADSVMYTMVYPVDDLLITIPNYTAGSLSGTGINSGGNSSGGGGSSGIGASGGGSSYGGSSAMSSSSPGGSGGSSSSGGGGGGSGGSSNQTAQQQGQALVKLIMDTIRPDIWKENGGTASIRFYKNSLVVTAPLSVQEAIGGSIN